MEPHHRKDEAERLKVSPRRLGDQILSRMVKAVSGIAGLGFGVRAQPVLLVSALVKTVLGLIVGRSALSPPLTRFRLIWR